MVKTPRIVHIYYRYLIVILVICFAVVTIYTVFKSYLYSNQGILSKRENEISKDIKNLHMQYKQNLVDTITEYSDGEIALNNKIESLVISNTDIIEIIDKLQNKPEDILYISQYHNVINNNKVVYKDKIVRLNSLSKVLNCYEKINIGSKSLTKDINKCELIKVDKYSIHFHNTYLYTNITKEYWQLVNKLYTNKIADTKLNKEVETKYKEMDKYRKLSEEEINQFIENNN